MLWWFHLLTFSLSSLPLFLSCAGDYEELPDDFVALANGGEMREYLSDDDLFDEDGEEGEEDGKWNGGEKEE